ncbi:MAG: (Fe-S)-binding protein [Woeseiaceae bacterium]|nr:(Fe-S)-binding protein [Woeseiaceae bacterium]
MNVESTSVHELEAAIENLEPTVERLGLSDEERVARAKRAFLRKLDGRKAVDLDTCLHCGMCAEACPFYETTQDERYAPVHKYRLLRRVYRRQLSPMRFLYRPFTPDITIDDLREWRHYVFDACTGCARCDMICPMGVNISSLIRIVREGIGAADLMPPRLQRMKDEQQQKNSIVGVDGQRLRQEIAKLNEQGVTVPIDKDGADTMLLTTVTELRMFPSQLGACASILTKAGANWTMYPDAFEAANIGYVAGDTAAMRVATKRIVDKAKEKGIKTVVVGETGHGYQTLRWLGANTVGERLPFDVVSIIEFIQQAQADGRIALKKQDNGASVTYLDPCRLSRKGGLIEQPREILKSMGFDVRETEPTGRENYCCGGGCGEYVLSTGSELRHRVFELKKNQFDDTEADGVVTACASCRFNLHVGADKTNWQMPIKSLVETVAANMAD